MRAQPDQIDEILLGELTRNARQSHADLAARVNLSRSAVRQRIERLERAGVIRGYTICRGEGSAAAATTIAMIFVYRKDRLRGGAVLAALKRIPEVTCCDVISGDFDIVLRVEAKNNDRIRAIWEEIALLPGVADTLTSFSLSSFVR